MLLTDGEQHAIDGDAISRTFGFPREQFEFAAARKRRRGSRQRRVWSFGTARKEKTVVKEIV